MNVHRQMFRLSLNSSNEIQHQENSEIFYFLHRQDRSRSILLCLSIWSQISVKCRKWLFQKEFEIFHLFLKRSERERRDAANKLTSLFVPIWGESRIQFLAKCNAKTSSWMFSIIDHRNDQRKVSMSSFSSSRCLFIECDTAKHGDEWMRDVYTKEREWNFV